MTIIRKAVENDAKEIARLLVSVGEVHWRARPDMYTPNMVKHDEEGVKALLLGGEYMALVAIAGDKTVGELIYKIERREENEIYKARKWLYIDDMCVDESARGSGVAQLPMDEAERIALNEGCVAVELNCWAFNTRAEKFYEKNGFLRQKSQFEKILKNKQYKMENTL